MALGCGVKSIATFRSDLRGRKGKYPPKEMRGSSTICFGASGKGIVVLESPHLESSTDMYVHSLFLGLFTCAAAEQKQQQMLPAS